MTVETSISARKPTEFDGWRSISLAFAVVGMLIYILMHWRLRAIDPVLASTAGTVAPVVP